MGVEKNTVLACVSAFIFCEPPGILRLHLGVFFFAISKIGELRSGSKAVHASP